MTDILREVATILGDPDGSLLVRSLVDERMLENLDFEPRCEDVWGVRRGSQPGTTGEQCGAPAAWVVVCLRCGHVAFSCDACRVHGLSESEVGCIGCGDWAPSVSLFRYEPIGGQS